MKTESTLNCFEPFRDFDKLQTENQYDTYIKVLKKLIYSIIDIIRSWSTTAPMYFIAIDWYENFLDDNRIDSIRKLLFWLRFS